MLLLGFDLFLGFAFMMRFAGDSVLCLEVLTAAPIKDQNFDLQ